MNHSNIEEIIEAIIVPEKLRAYVCFVRSAGFIGTEENHVVHDLLSRAEALDWLKASEALAAYRSANPDFEVETVNLVRHYCEGVEPTSAGEFFADDLGLLARATGCAKRLAEPAMRARAAVYITKACQEFSGGALTL